MMSIYFANAKMVTPTRLNALKIVLSKSIVATCGRLVRNKQMLGRENAEKKLTSTNVDHCRLQHSIL